VVARVAHLLPERVARIALINPTFLARDPRHALLSKRVSRVAALVPVWRRLAPEWLASALHGALLPAYAQRTSGAHSLDLYLKSFRTREGRDAACAQLLAFKLSRSDAGPALAPGAIRCPTVLALGDNDPMLSAGNATRLQTELREATSGNLVVHHIPGVAHVAPEEAPDRLGTLIAELLTR
jgi:pimeloyl-ACP methyl ester carboxylesterase